MSWDEISKELLELEHIPQYTYSEFWKIYNQEWSKLVSDRQEYNMFLEQQRNFGVEPPTNFNYAKAQKLCEQFVQEDDTDWNAPMTFLQ